MKAIVPAIIAVALAVLYTETPSTTPFRFLRARVWYLLLLAGIAICIALAFIEAYR